MSEIIDLTCPFPEKYRTDIRPTEVPLRSDKTAYTGLVYDFRVHSMSGSYLDLPGHIRETDDDVRADHVPPGEFYRVPCSVIRLERKNNSGAVGAAELETAFGGVPRTPALILNALGGLEPDGIEKRSVYLDFSALDWIIQAGVRLLVSDIYESRALHGVFLRLFQHGVRTVCEPRNLHRIPGKTVLLSVLFPKIPVLTQIPCRILAEIPENHPIKAGEKADHEA